MPSVNVSKRQLQTLLQSDQHQTSVSTPLGNMMLEIQGDLEIPHQWHDDERFTMDGNHESVRWGLLYIDTVQNSATLFVGRKQRLLGSLVKLDTPLGLIKFNQEERTVEMQDIFHYKVLFKSRPLPIM